MPSRLAVLGSPVAHSKSPLLHTAAAQVMGLDWDYRRVEVDQEALPGFLGTRGPEWIGLSLTMPLKRAVLPLVGGHDPLVDRLGLANTVRLGREPALFNTDVGGIEAVLADRAGAALGVVLGAGATAASAVAALGRLGVEQVVVAARRPTAAAADLAALAPRIVSLAEAPVAAADVVVSTLPGTASAVLVPPPIAGTPMLDVAYAPWPTPTGAAWVAAGGTLRHGLDLLVEQAVLQVRVFTGGDVATRPVREEAVRAAMRAAVGRPGR